MDRANLERRIANVDQRIVEGERHIAQQTKLIRGMHRLGQDMVESARLLGIFEETLRLHRADRDRLSTELNVDGA